MNRSELVREFAAQTARKKQLEADIKTCNKELESLGAQILEWFVEDGIHSQRTIYGTPYIHTQVWASAPDDELTGEKDYERLQAALISAGFGDLVKPNVNVQSLSALVREWPRGTNGEIVIPKEMEGSIKITEKPEIRIRGAKGENGTSSNGE